MVRLLADILFFFLTKKKFDVAEARARRAGGSCRERARSAATLLYDVTPTPRLLLDELALRSPVLLGLGLMKYLKVVHKVRKFCDVKSACNFLSVLAGIILIQGHERWELRSQT